jgi:ribosomal protein S18 acetylase RimI-like enzyme
MLADDGVAVVLTGALSTVEQPAYLAAGFHEHARLHVLERALHTLAEPKAAAPLRRARRRDRQPVLEVDHAAFPPFWRLDGDGLDDALAATPAARFRVAAPQGMVVGYAICGRAGGHGYVQRLAVRPAMQRRGVATALLLDGLHWLRRHGAADAVVNTQVDNDRALRLYERHGFRRRADDLLVLRREL